MPDREVVIKDRRHGPTLALKAGSRVIDLLSWKGLVTVASGIAVLYGASQIIGSVTGLTISSKTARQISDLTELVRQEALIRASADSESRADRAFIRAQMGDLTLAICGALGPDATPAVHQRCDDILRSSLNRR